jgi:hypothetical protein
VSKRIVLELSIGHTHGTEKTYYSDKQVKELLADSGLPCTILSGEGIEDSLHSFEDTSIIKIIWNETINGKVEVFCKLLSDFLGKVADKMHQRWVLLVGHAFSGDSMYPINIYLNLEGFGEVGKNLKERRSMHPDELFNPQLVFRGRHTEPYDWVESKTYALQQAARRTSTLLVDSREFPTAQLDTIDAIYMLDDYLELRGVRPVSSVNQPVPFDLDVFYRVYFDYIDTPHESDDDLPHADIFCQSDGEFCIEYDFIPTATPAEVECLELIVKTREFQRSALKRWGGFKLIWGGPGNNEAYDVGANMLLYFDDQIAFVTLRRVGTLAGMTFVELLSDYMFLLQAASRKAEGR